MPISRSTHSSEPVASHPRRKSASPAGGRADGSAGAGVVPGMKSKEENLAGYLMARAAMNQKIEGRDLFNLRVGNATVQSTCELLPLGRANVSQDIRKARETYIPTLHHASKSMALNLMGEMLASGGRPNEIDYSRATAATALFSKTGTCGSYSAIVNPLFASKLHQMKDTRAVVAQAKNDTIDHVWNDMLTQGRKEDGTPILHGNDVIMDGWSKEHLAVLREDSEFGRLDQNGNASLVTHLDFLDHETGRQALRDVGTFKAKIDESAELQRAFRKEVRHLKAANARLSRECIWEDTSIFHADFREQAGKAVHTKAPSRGEGAGIQGAEHEAEQAKASLTADIQAVGVARSLGANIRGAVSEAPDIIASARDMFPDPR